MKISQDDKPTVGVHQIRYHSAGSTDTLDEQGGEVNKFQYVDFVDEGHADFQEKTKGL